MVAHFLWQQRRLDEIGVQGAEREALDAAAGELEQLWADLTRAQRQVLGKSTAQQARDTLSAEGHLRREPDNRVAIVDPFLARWLRR